MGIAGLNLLLVLVCIPLSACKTHSGLLNQRAIKNCSTVSQVDVGALNLISCLIQEEKCFTSKINQPQNKPCKLSTYWCLSEAQEGSWYVFHESSSSNAKIALNFTWSPAPDSSIQNVQGYHIRISKLTDNGSLPLQQLFYCLNTSLTFSKHRQAIFYYDSYGKSVNFPVYPGEKYGIDIYSIPEYNEIDNNHLHLKISIPSCVDPQLINVTGCVIERKLSLKVNDIICKNRTISYTYNLPEECGSMANIQLCHILANENKSCNAIETFPHAESRRFLEISEKHFKWENNLTLSVWGSSKSHMTSTKEISLASCSGTLSQKNFILLTTLCSSLFLILLFFALLIAKWSHASRSKSAVYSAMSPLDNLDVNSTTGNNTNNICIYLLFVEDNPMHTEVVAQFANYLQKDLGFSVIFWPWETIRSMEKSSDWMQNALDSADKVISIWSPDACNNWDHYDSSSRESINDLFTPVMRHIQEHQFHKKYASKYYFSYFSYCLPSVVPKQFQGNKFKLMEDFERLYFQLIDTEKFVPGGVTRVKEVSYASYFNTEVNCGGPGLHKAIQGLCQHVEHSGNWHISTNGKPSNVIPPKNLACECELRNLLAVQPPEEAMGVECTDTCSLQDSTEENNSTMKTAEKSFDTIELLQNTNLEFRNSDYGTNSQGSDCSISETPVFRTNRKLQEEVKLQFSQNNIPCSPVKLAPIEKDGDPVQQLKKINVFHLNTN